MSPEDDIFSFNWNHFNPIVKGKLSRKPEAERKTQITGFFYALFRPVSGLPPLASTKLKSWRVGELESWRGKKNQIRNPKF
jgi:hypothetical protein